MTSGVTYRKAESRDFDSFYEIFDSVAKEGEFFGETSAPNRNGLKRFFDSLIENGSPFMIAEIAGNTVGWGHIYPMNGTPYSHNFVFAVSILSEHRNSGIGRELSTKLLNSLKVGIVRIEVLSTNKRAIHLYETLGFRFDGERLKYVKIGENLINLTLMSREIKQEEDL
jgi:ribosomal protein S18 acetylase RimI-like enzyme